MPRLPDRSGQRAQNTRHRAGTPVHPKHRRSGSAWARALAGPLNAAAKHVVRSYAEIRRGGKKRSSQLETTEARAGSCTPLRPNMTWPLFAIHAGGHWRFKAGNSTSCCRNGVSEPASRSLDFGLKAAATQGWRPTCCCSCNGAWASNTFTIPGCRSRNVGGICRRGGMCQYVPPGCGFRGSDGSRFQLGIGTAMFPEQT